MPSSHDEHHTGDAEPLDVTRVKLEQLQKVLGDLETAKSQMEDIAESMLKKSQLEKQERSESLLAELTALQSKMYVTLNSIQKKPATEAPADEGLDAQATSKTSADAAQGGNEWICTFGGFVVGAMTGLLLVQAVRKKAMASAAMRPVIKAAVGQKIS